MATAYAMDRYLNSKLTSVTRTDVVSKPNVPEILTAEKALYKTEMPKPGFNLDSYTTARANHYNVSDLDNTRQETISPGDHGDANSAFVRMFAEKLQRKGLKLKVRGGSKSKKYRKRRASKKSKSRRHK